MHGIQCGTADSSDSSSVGSSYTHVALLHERFSTSEEVTAVLHAREDVQRASSGDSEELSRRCECRSVAQTGQKYELGVGIRYDVILGSLLKRRSGEHDEAGLGL